MKNSALFLAIVLGLGGCVAPVTDEPGDAGDADESPPLIKAPMPEPLMEAWLLQRDGQLLEVALQKELWNYGHAHPHDARPWLLLARDSVRREWTGFAVSQYRLAITADVRAKQEPEVLPYLIGVVRDYVNFENEEATALIRSAWGTEALRAVEDAREAALRAGQLIQADRLEKLREALIGEVRLGP